MVESVKGDQGHDDAEAASRPESLKPVSNTAAFPYAEGVMETVSSQTRNSAPARVLKYQNYVLGFSRVWAARAFEEVYIGFVHSINPKKCPLVSQGASLNVQTFRSRTNRKMQWLSGD